MEQDALRFALLFVGFVLKLISLGFIDARVSTRHPQEKERLGVLFASMNLAGWPGLILLGHFSKRDLLLSVLCIANIVISVALITLLFRFWSPPTLAV